MSQITALALQRPADGIELDLATQTIAPAAPDPAKASRQSNVAARAAGSRSETVLKKLRLARGVTVTQIVEATGWQSHSVRGFFSAVIRKKLNLNLVSEVGKDGQRRYRIVDDVAKTAV